MAEPLGTLVIAYAHEGRDYESGGWTAAAIEWLRPELEARGCKIATVRDGIEWAREEFPAGARVVAAGKWWLATVATVTGHYRLTRREGRMIGVRFDDGWATDWPSTGLTVIGNAGKEQGRG